MSFLLAPPPYLTIFLIVAGLVLIHLQVRTPQAGRDAATTVEVPAARWPELHSAAPSRDPAPNNNEAAEAWLREQRDGPIKKKFKSLDVTDIRPGGPEDGVGHRVDQYISYWQEDDRRLTLGIRNDDRSDTAAYFYVADKPGKRGADPTYPYKGADGAKALATFIRLVEKAKWPLRAKYR